MGARIYINNRPPHVQFLSTHRSIRLQFARRMGAQTDTLQWRHIYCSLYIYYGASDHSSNLKRDHARAMNELARIGDVRSVSVFCFSVPKFVYQVKKQYSTVNTVLLLPLTTKKQYRTALNPTNAKINNSTTVLLYMTPTYNSKTAIQYHMIYNNCPLFPLPCEEPFSPFASDPHFTPGSK